MNRREKEEYLREYARMKAEGKPFFPYAVAKDGVVLILVMAIIIFMSIMLGAEIGPKADPTSTTYTPRPEWYYFFSFELLRIIKDPALLPLASVGILTICMILLFLLPFYDRSPERRPERRPVATIAGIMTIVAMTYLTYEGAVTGPPSEISLETPAHVIAADQKNPGLKERFEAGRQVAAQSGCLACHKLGENGNAGPGPDLTEIADTLPEAAIRQTLINPTSPMPSFKSLAEEEPEKFENLVTFLGQLEAEE
jgi:ubiquinol-cytochrome c reductase cytochrome b subunit/menaquinol-cytochrome c reductase cytochrome b/c subunit